MLSGDMAFDRGKLERGAPPVLEEAAERLGDNRYVSLNPGIDGERAARAVELWGEWHHFPCGYAANIVSRIGLTRVTGDSPALLGAGIFYALFAGIVDPYEEITEYQREELGNLVRGELAESADYIAERVGCNVAAALCGIPIGLRHSLGEYMRQEGILH